MSELSEQLRQVADYISARDTDIVVPLKAPLWDVLRTAADQLELDEEALIEAIRHELPGNITKAWLKERIDQAAKAEGRNACADQLDRPKENTIGQCECATWARLYLEHHSNCKLYQPEKEIRDLLLRLIDGIETWAADEDGVHPDCWEAYKAACSAVGAWTRIEGESDEEA